MISLKFTYEFIDVKLGIEGKKREVEANVIKPSC